MVEEELSLLDPASRAAFQEGIVDAAVYQDLKTEQNPREAFARLRGVLETLVRGVGLPTVGEHEWSKTLDGRRKGSGS